MARPLIFAGLLLQAVVFLTSIASAEVTLPRVIGSNMLLQRDVPVNIWGRATSGEKIVVRFAGREMQTSARPDGTWSVVFDAMPASDVPHDMLITGINEITLSNIVVGDVWVCSGQSNMEYSLKHRPDRRKLPAGVVDQAQLELDKGKHDGIRLFQVKKQLSKTPDEDLRSDGWTEAEGTALENFSAVAFFFAKEVYERTKVPIGIVHASWGGTRIEVWTADDVYAKYPGLNAPTTRPLFLDHSPVGRHYASMVKPLTPYAIKGFLWYQGESNCFTGESDRYTLKMRALIESWRGAWKSPRAPFYYVQITPLSYSERVQEPPLPRQLPRDALPKFWEAQTRALAIPHTGMAVTTDLCQVLNDIHPYNKWDVGHRLAVLALARDYKMTDVISSGPTFKEMHVDKSTVVARFTEVGMGLKTSDGRPPSHFQLAGEDGVFAQADTRIVGTDTVTLTSAKVSRPKWIRFAWDEAAQPNFFNSADLPAVPFRTDKLF